MEVGTRLDLVDPFRVEREAKASEHPLKGSRAGVSATVLNLITMVDVLRLFFQAPFEYLRRRCLNGIR
jgi:hypothetical protein